MRVVINPFLSKAPLLYPLKTSGNRWFPDVFRGYRSGTLVKSGFKKKSNSQGRRFVVFIVNLAQLGNISHNAQGRVGCVVEVRLRT